MSNQQTLKFIQECIDKTNEKAVSRAATIKKWIILKDDFSEKGDELTPSLKLRRKVVEKKYAKEINTLYDISE